MTRQERNGVYLLGTNGVRARLVTARETHLCSKCGGLIAVGDQYWRESDRRGPYILTHEFPCEALKVKS